MVADQFEELFTQNTAETQARFAELLGRVVLEADVFVLLSMRDDFSGAEAELRRSIELFDRVLRVDPQYVEVLHHIATAYWKLGETDPAKVYDERYVESGKHDDLLKISRDRLARGSSG